MCSDADNRPESWGHSHESAAEGWRSQRSSPGLRGQSCTHTPLGWCQLKGPQTLTLEQSCLGWMAAQHRGACPVPADPGRAEPGAVSCDPPPSCSWAHWGNLSTICAMIPRPCSVPSSCPGVFLGDPTPMLRLSSALIPPEAAFGGGFCSGHAQLCCISVPAGEPSQHFYPF